MPLYEVTCKCSETSTYEETYKVEANSEKEAITIAESIFYEQKATGEIKPWFSDNGSSYAEEIE